MAGLNHSGCIPPWEEEVSVMAHTLPGFLVDDPFSLVVYVVDRSFLEFPFFVPEGVEDRDVADAEAVDELVVVHEAVLFDVEDEVCLPDGCLLVAELRVDDVVVIEDA